LNVLFPPIKKIWLLPKKQQKQLHQEHDNTVATLTASTVVTKENEKSIKKKRLKVGDELLKYFKEKRKKLIRDEITFSLLPSRTIVE
jgi:uncharacterized protein YdcH (DUF465 family)